MLEWKQVLRVQERSGSKENYLGDIWKRDVAEPFAKNTVIVSEQEGKKPEYKDYPE